MKRVIKKVLQLVLLLSCTRYVTLQLEKVLIWLILVSFYYITKTWHFLQGCVDFLHPLEMRTALSIEVIVFWCYLFFIKLQVICTVSLDVICFVLIIKSRRQSGQGMTINPCDCTSPRPLVLVTGKVHLNILVSATVWQEANAAPNIGWVTLNHPIDTFRGIQKTYFVFC